MLLGKTIREYHTRRQFSSSPQTETKFKFPDPKPKPPSAINPTTNHNETEDEEMKKAKHTIKNDLTEAPEDDKKKIKPTNKNDGLVNITAMLLVMKFLRDLIASSTSVPPLKVPTLYEILPGRLPLPNFVLIVYPIWAILGNNDKIFSIII